MLRDYFFGVNSAPATQNDRMIDVLRDYFHGDTLEATKDDAGVWVPVKRICEVFGIDLKGQHRKLKGKSWAVMCIMHMTATDGGVYSMLCIHLDSLPMWFATIDTRRVKAELRPKLATYQKECARVLRDYFYGVNSAPATQNDRIIEAINSGYQAMVQLRGDPERPDDRRAAGLLPRRHPGGDQG